MRGTQCAMREDDIRMRQKRNNGKITAALLVAGLCMSTVTGCAGQDAVSVESEGGWESVATSADTGAESDSTVDAQGSTAAASESTGAETKANAETTDAGSADSTETAQMQSAANDTGDSFYYGIGQSTQVLAAPPSWDYYCNPDNTISQKPAQLVLKQISAKDNGISMSDEWLGQNNLKCVDEDAQYSYVARSGGEYRGTEFEVNDVLELHSVAAGANDTPRSLDFSNYVFPDSNPVGDEKRFGEQQVIWAESVDNILYVATGHDTYASTSNGKNAYITAIDLNNMSVLWRSQPLVCNSHNFAIVNGVIICGYGFTDEKDYLYELSGADGTVMAQIPLKTGADQIVVQNDIVYVHTYNTDYQFKIQK